MWLCDEIIEEKKTNPTILMKNPQKPCKKFVYVTCILLIAVALLVAVNTFYYLIKYWAKQKTSPIYVANYELKEVIHW